MPVSTAKEYLGKGLQGLEGHDKTLKSVWGDLVVFRMTVSSLYPELPVSSTESKQHPKSSRLQIFGNPRSETERERERERDQQQICSVSVLEAATDKASRSTVALCL